MDERLTAPWHPFEAIPLAVGAFALTVLWAVGLGLAGIGGNLLFLLGGAFQQVALALGTLAWVSFRYRGSMPALGLRSHRAARDVVAGAFFGVGLFALVAFAVFPLVVLVWRAITGRAPGPFEQIPIDLTHPAALVGAAVLVALVTPVAEEIFFRGFLYSALRSRLALLPSAAISAAAFALLHPPPQLMVVIFVVGLAFAFLYERRGSLAAPIAAHSAFNIIGFVLIVMQR